MTTVYRIPDTLAGQYKGCGLALAAICDDEVVALRYLADLVPPAVADRMVGESEHAMFFARLWLGSDEAGRVIREMQALGEVIVGMCSSWEITVL